METKVPTLLDPGELGQMKTNGTENLNIRIGTILRFLTCQELTAMDETNPGILTPVGRRGKARNGRRTGFKMAAASLPRGKMAVVSLPRGKKTGCLSPIGLMVMDRIGWSMRIGLNPVGIHYRGRATLNVPDLGL